METELLTPNKVKTEEAAIVSELFKFICKNCDESFRWEKDLSKHRRLHCKKKPFGCPECGQLLSRRDSLRQHLQRHDGGKKYSCKYCDKHFDQQQNLKVHMRIHSGIKPYQCPECGRQFNQSQNLTTHLRVHSGEKPYVCSDCGARFRFCSGYKSHISRSHDPSKPRKHERKSMAETEKPKIQVHRVSVIAKASSSSFVDQTAPENVVLNSHENHCGESATSVFEKVAPDINLLDNFLPFKLKYKCRVCHVECFRQLDMLQHISEAHGAARYDILECRPPK